MLDSILSDDAPPGILQPWAHGAARVTMLYAIAFRLLSDDPPDVDAYASVLMSITTRTIHS